jgi:hypothetical protein
VQKIKLSIILILLFLKGYSQGNQIPTAVEIPKKGLYKTFEEFKFNVPSITDSFFVEGKMRTQQNWEGTMSYTSRYASSNKKVKKVWRFSDSQNVFAFHQ